MPCHPSLRNLYKPLLLLSLLATASLPTAASADPSDMTAQIETLQKQVELLQKQLNEVKAAQKAQKTQEVKQAAANKAEIAEVRKEVKDLPAEKDKDKKVKVTVGGFVEAAAISRSRNETSDIGSNFNTGIPYPNSNNYNVSEFRGTARQSRLSLLAQGAADKDTDLAAFFESDFLGAAPTANSNESNSYNPRLRQVYATADMKDVGFHFLGGQAWSLITMNKVGITPRQENIPLTIDAQYVPGFTWTRNWQLRAVKDFDDKKLWAGISLESPQTLIYAGPNTPAGSPFYNNAGSNGGSGFSSSATYSLDVAPDLIVKAAADPGYGHYEVYGIGRAFRDRYSNDNSIIFGGGGGAAALLPLIEKKLDFQISGLIGKGVGRYGSTQMPDVTLKPNGGFDAVEQGSLLLGLIGHPKDNVDAYLYAGTEYAWKDAFVSGATGYGYGSPLYNNSGCLTLNGTCTASTKQISQLTGGFWWKLYRGNMGTMQVGLQDSFTKRYIFEGVGGNPSTDENITMFSFRYYPF